MKKLMLICVGALALTTTKVSAQAFEEGTSAATLGYGFPNLAASWMKLWTTGAENAKTTSFGPIHAKYEYGLTDKLGLGASINFASAKVTNTYMDSEYNETTFTYTDVERTEEIKYSSISVLVRLNWHFLDHDKVDFYSGLGLGYNKNTFKYTNTDPDVNAEEEVTFLNDLYNLIPIGYEATLGLRYYFTDNIGAYMEVGYGKSLMQAGVAFKF